MLARLRSIAVAMAVFIVMIAVIGLSRPNPMENAAADTLQAMGPLKWYRGNLHTHSNWSDGDDYLESIALWYIEHGYDFLAFTDHNLLANKERWVDVKDVRGGQTSFEKRKTRFPDGWVEERTTDGKLETRLKRFDEVYARFNQKDKFLLIQGEEISDRFEHAPIHLNANNLVEAIPPMGGTSVSEVIQNNVDALIAQRERTGRRMMIHLNHPNFGWGITAEDLAPIRGESFFEVYNGHPHVNNSGDQIHASTERMWDIINAMRLTEFDLPLLYGLATDDGHNYHSIPSRSSEPGRGWIVVLSDQLEPEALIRAMEAGRFYASSGVTLDKVVVTQTGIEITVHPDPNAVYTIDFIGTRKGFDPTSEPIENPRDKTQPVTRKYSDQIGMHLKTEVGFSANYRFTGDELFVRARVTSSRLHPNPSEIGERERAWIQPVRP